jgi:uncharacterized NAD-dependent epimerase/dehydratase family protein
MRWVNFQGPGLLYLWEGSLRSVYINEERNLILEAMENGMDIINGLHQFFSEDREFVHVAARNACPN